MLYATVKLYCRTGIKGEFKAYEDKALALFRKHGGEILVAYVPIHDSTATDLPDEIQVLRIAGMIEFDRFMKDPARLAMSEERDLVIRKTEVYLSEEIIQY